MKTIVLSCALAAAVSVGCGAREPTKERKLVADTLLELDLTSAPEERTSALLGEAKLSHFESLMRLRKLQKDPLARGLFVRLGSFGGHFADVDDWATTFEGFRAEKKPVHCQFDELDNTGYALASHCDRVSMTPAGLLNLVGIAVQVVQGRQLLEMVGVQADLFQAGKYKGAAEPFTRDDLSPEQKQSLETLLEDLDQSFRSHLLKRTERAPAELQTILDQGPYTSQAAKQIGLVDAVAYDDEARAQAKLAAKARQITRPLEPNEKQTVSLTDVLRALSGKKEHDYEGHAHLGVAFLTGDISDGQGRSVTGAASDPFVKALRRWGDESDVRAVVLRIESPGGSALASDRMWHAVQRVAKRKPVIVSLGDMAASGGYYVASAGSTIVAAPGSIVGSIGVVGGKMVVSGLAQRAGVHVTSLPRAAHATWLSPFAPFAPSERAAFTGMLQNTYGRFLDRVALGRKRDVSAIVPAAEGRVMGGEHAKKLGLVDEVGGFERAVSIALERGKLPSNALIETWPEADDPFEALSSLVSTKAPQALLGSELQETLPIELLTAGSLLRELAAARQRPLAVLPFALHVR
ncbi:MAG: Protease [Myxococcaceae bacterium]|nr:Protease [Myxococcaceae bacterium]